MMFPILRRTVRRRIFLGPLVGEVQIDRAAFIIARLFFGIKDL